MKNPPPEPKPIPKIEKTQLKYAGKAPEKYKITDEKRIMVDSITPSARPA